MPRGSGRGAGELSAVACSVQPGTDRFPRYEFPSLAHGRNNLTAISSKQDLYFVAVYDEIYVYKPWFPKQKLSDRLYKWPLPVTAHGLQGYIDRRRPHAVNALLVDHLGHEEVLVAACDDGDVLMYYTRAIQAMIDAQEEGKDPAKYWKPFLIENVGQSAWGIAVHTNARMLAVSCNSYCITVFAFALTDDSILYNDPDSEWQYPGRIKDMSLHLHDHTHNIPNITFYNSDLDKEGRFLVSTDLSGKVVLWDLRERSKMKEINMPRRGLGLPTRNSGWSVLCIDPRSFLMTRTDDEFLGLGHCRFARSGLYDISESRSLVPDASILFDNLGSAANRNGPNEATRDSNMIDTIRHRVATTRSHLVNLLEDMDRRGTLPDAQTPLRALTAAVEDAEASLARTRAGAIVEDMMDDDSDEEESDEAEDSEEEDFDERDTDDADLDEEESNGEGNHEHELGTDLNQMDVEEVSDTPTTAGSSRSNPSEYEASNPVSTTQTLARGQRLQSYEDIQPIPAFASAAAEMRLTISRSRMMNTSIQASSGDLESSDDEEYMRDSQTIWPESHERSTLRPSRRRPLISHKRPAMRVARPLPTPPNHFDVPFLLLQTGQDFVSLQQPPFDQVNVISRDPCHQHLPPSMSWLDHLDRLHLTRAIPELNLVIVATATGRAAIYTTTRKAGTPATMLDDEFGLRLDYILPFASQELRNQRPAAALIGIAAAPLQGHESQPGIVIPDQRWRLLLTYSDHTVMSYELWRKGHTLNTGGKFY